MFVRPLKSKLKICTSITFWLFNLKRTVLVYRGKMIIFLKEKCSYYWLHLFVAANSSWTWVFWLSVYQLIKTTVNYLMIKYNCEPFYCIRAPPELWTFRLCHEFFCLWIESSPWMSSLCINTCGATGPCFPYRKVGAAVHMWPEKDFGSVPW